MASTVLNAKNSSLNPGLHNVAFHNKFFITYLFNGKNYDCLSVLLDAIIILFSLIFFLFLSDVVFLNG